MGRKVAGTSQAFVIEARRCRACPLLTADERSAARVQVPLLSDVPRRFAVMFAEAGLFRGVAVRSPTTLTCQEPRKRLAVDAGKLLEFNHIQPALARLALRKKR